MNNKMFEFDLDYGEVIGIDEAGRGPLAGPVVAAAVKMKNFEEFMNNINDSKKLTIKKREMLYELLINSCYYAIAIVDNEIIDEINILEATFKAMRETLKKFNISKEIILVDGNLKIKEIEYFQEPIVKGDSKSLAIASASILAKVARDRIMDEFDQKYPEYGFKKHKGYGTVDHIEKIKKFGPSPIHRKSFLRKILNDF